MINKSIKEFVNQTSSSSPTPGGGSVSALVGSLGAALSSMVVSLTKGKKNYLDVEDLMNEIQSKLDLIQIETQEFINKDIEAYNFVMAQYALPKNNDEEKQIRSNKIQEATIKAAYVPLALATRLLDIYPLAETLLEKGNKNAYSDALISVILCHAAIESSLCNVIVNKNLIKDESIKLELTSKINEILEKSINTKNRLVESSKYFE